MNIKLTDISFNINLRNDRCCLNTFKSWCESKVTRVGADEDAEELWIGDVEVGTVITCPHCGSNFLLNEQGEFKWVDPDEFDLVDAAKEPLMVTGPIEPPHGRVVDTFGNTDNRPIA